MVAAYRDASNGALMPSGSRGPQPNPGIGRLSRWPLLACLETLTSGVHTQGTYMLSFIFFHAKKYRVTGVCGREGAVLAVHQDGQREAELHRSATVLI